MLMLCSEWWAYEVLTVMAGVLGKEEVSAQAILMQILSLSFMVPLGM
jgi:MATE family multidrug resistance protein